MTEKTSTAAKKSQPITKNAPESLPSSASIPNKHAKTPMDVILVIVVIIAVGSVFYALKTTKALRQSTNQQIQTLLTQVKTLQHQQVDNKTQFDDATKTLTQAQDKLSNQLNTIDHTIQSVIQQRAYQTKDWLLLKARYYLELAQINAQWSENTQTTSTLLQQADLILASIHEQGTFNIRQAIAKEIAQLKAIPIPDIAGTLSQLDAALAQVSKLPLKPVVSPPSTKNENTKQNETYSSWRQRLRSSVGLLEKLVVIRHHDEDLEPLPSPAYEAMVREGIRLYLQEAQWAVLHNNDAVYQLSLKQAINNINQSFAANAVETTALMKQLRALQQIKLVQQKPIVDQSLPLLNQLIDSKDSQPGDIKQNTGGENAS